LLGEFKDVGYAILPETVCSEKTYPWRGCRRSVWRGDEFLAVLTETALQGVQAILQRLHNLQMEAFGESMSPVNQLRSL
jgi:hypothetical protein